MNDELVFLLGDEVKPTKDWWMRLGSEGEIQHPFHSKVLGPVQRGPNPRFGTCCDYSK